MKKTTPLESNEALVLQQIYEDGDNSLNELSASLQLNKGRVRTIVNRLRKKHLVAIRKQAGEALITLSEQGKRLLSTMWPDGYRLPAGSY